VKKGQPPLLVFNTNNGKTIQLAFMCVELKQAKPYTFVSIPFWPGGVKRTEVHIMSYSPHDQIYSYREKGHRQIVYLPCEGEIEDYLILEGHDLPFLLDTETAFSLYNGCFNFIADSPDNLRQFIRQYCLNPSFLNFIRVLYYPSERTVYGLSEAKFLFPECLQQMRLKFSLDEPCISCPIT
jgi:hypothetical protein